MRVLVLNSGSSSLKFQLVDVKNEDAPPTSGGCHTVVRGAVKGIGGTAILEFTRENIPSTKTTQLVRDHRHATREVFEHLQHADCGARGESLLAGVQAVGHRVVHGGERFAQPVMIDDAVITEIDALSELAPLHNPVCLEGIYGARDVLGTHVPMVAVFDTAFHHTMPPVARTYALPHDLASRHRIHRYGFHGIAHASLAAGYAACSGDALDKTKLITLQLGNGCSVTAIENGQSVETSMGFTPLEGMVMGTRSGDVDPSVVSYLAEKEHVAASVVESWLNERSGLLGVSGRTNDMRTLLMAANDDQDKRARLAIELFCYRARKYIGAYLAVLGGADAVVFGGGIGEASPDIRARISQGMEWCGLRLDTDRNNSAVGLAPGRGSQISHDGATLAAYVVAANEETWIARETVRCLRRR